MAVLKYVCVHSFVQRSTLYSIDQNLGCRLNAKGPRVVHVAAKASKQYDYDLVIIGCGVGGHGAALHAVESVCYCLLASDASGAMNEWEPFAL